MSNPPSPTVIFLCGTLGALAPEIARLYRLRRGLRGARFPFSYWVISALYAALGGALAVMLPAVNLYAAFYAGVTLPVAISAMLRQGKAPETGGDAPRAAAPSGAWRRLREHAAGLFAA
jgi:hypothetical protein